MDNRQWMYVPQGNFVTWQNQLHGAQHIVYMNNPVYVVAPQQYVVPQPGKQKQVKASSRKQQRGNASFVFVIRISPYPMQLIYHSGTQCYSHAILSEITDSWQQFCNMASEWLASQKPCKIAINSSPLNKMAAILQTIFSDAFSWTKSYVFWLKFLWSLFIRVQFTITQYWFR